MRALSHLWAKAPAPFEYIKHVICRDVWHCPPSVFRQQSFADLQEALICLAAEAQVREMQSKRTPRRTKSA